MNNLKNIFTTAPKYASSFAISKWKTLPNLTVEEILTKNGLTEKDINPSQHEFKAGIKRRERDGNTQYIMSGIFIKGTNELRIGREESLG